jgi:hypothetical protein
MLHRSNTAIGYGSITVTFLTGTFQTYILEDWDPKFPVTQMDRKDNLSRPNGFVQVDDARSGNAVFQLSTGAQPVPIPGDRFIVDAVEYVVGEVNNPKKQGEIWKGSFQFRENV